MNTIYIPDPKDNIGGPSTFLRSLRLKISGKIGITTNFFKADILFFPISSPMWAVMAFKFSGCPVIQRLDGIYYPEKHGQDSRIKNKYIRMIYLYFASEIVFQSEYSKKQCLTLFGPPSTRFTSVIYNGCISTIFNVEAPEKQTSSSTCQLTSVGKFREKDMILPLLDMIKNLDKSKFDFHLIGTMEQEYVEKFKNFPNVFFHGVKNSEEIALRLKQTDIFVFSHASAPCPNAVIEAISSGIPVVSFDTGSLKELNSFNTELLAPTPEKVFHSYKDLDGKKLALKVELCNKSLLLFKNRSRLNSRKFEMERCANLYLEIFLRQRVKPVNVCIKNILLFFFGALNVLVRYPQMKLKRVFQKAGEMCKA